jgi:hypothetical protein
MSKLPCISHGRENSPFNLPRADARTLENWITLCASLTGFAWGWFNCRRRTTLSRIINVYSAYVCVLHSFLAEREFSSRSGYFGNWLHLHFDNAEIAGRSAHTNKRALSSRKKIQCQTPLDAHIIALLHEARTKELFWHCANTSCTVLKFCIASQILTKTNRLQKPSLLASHCLSAYL